MTEAQNEAFIYFIRSHSFVPTGSGRGFIQSQEVETPLTTSIENRFSVYIYFEKLYDCNFYNSINKISEIVIYPKSFPRFGVSPSQRDPFQQDPGSPVGHANHTWSSVPPRICSSDSVYSFPRKSPRAGGRINDRPRNCLKIRALSLQLLTLSLHPLQLCHYLFPGYQSKKRARSGGAPSLVVVFFAPDSNNYMQSAEK